MNQTAGMMVKVVRGPDGSPLTIADLPSPDTKRWVIRRKAEVVAAVRGGLLSLDEACSRYALNNDEFLSWQYYLDRYGFAGLRTTMIQSGLRGIEWVILGLKTRESWGLQGDYAFWRGWNLA
jgi:hypothetical protein